MAGMQDNSDIELDGAGENFSGRYALQDRCDFQMA